MGDDERTKGDLQCRLKPLRVIEGGRDVLERQALWAVALGQPDADALMRRLDRPANASLSVVPPSDTTTLQPLP
tara:strand:+ start:3386 stop:3607 length:222 start_codon:yes stop_codon:yes gene_type:complete